MHKKILEYINKEKLIPANTTIIVGVSGGPDSTFLTETLVALKKPLKIEKIILAHVNHHTRDNSTNDQYTVENLAKKHNLPLIIKNAQFKNPTEENMRNARIRFFKKTAQTYGAQKIALGHTQDDNIETFLLFLLRGSGLNGLSGIQQKKTTIHPLLETQKKSLIAYLEKHNIPFTTDPTNAKNIYTRNSIRNKVLPLIKKEINPSITQTLSQTISVLNNSKTALELLIQSEIKKLNPSKKNTCISFPAKTFFSLPPVIQTEITITLIRETDIGMKNINSKAIQRAIKNLQSKKKNTIIPLKEGLHLLMSHDTISLHF